ncbi:SRPBCC family protein [Acanthopleuribacter pedis]|uniref:SRPBCC domain-containing protein n=1 Tax=Acanthopleuribacter pedis TaxID=442870 RepID=A0A8J7Q4A1_9BACT|nr:SRPBCC domain-containing protein [Acanthopleuribacter pedis]MBO1320302.1 SRPBCC domain-containing protein [Acanthopleuribacter pedis]
MSDITLSRVFDAPVNLVFQAWRDPAMMSRWFFPGDMLCTATCDFRVGGRYRLDMRGRDGQAFPHHGEYRDIVEARRISFTWNSDSVSDTLVTVSFEDLGAQTRLTLVHQGLATENAREKHNEGWQGCFENLAHFVTKQTADAPAP